MSEDIVKVINNENPVINLEITAYKNIVDVNFLQSIDSVIAGHNEYIDAHRKIQDEVALKANLSDMQTGLAAKADAVIGKGLSANDLTNELKSNYDKAYANNHKHNNQSALDLVTGTNTGDQDLSALATKTLSNVSLSSALANLGFTGQSLTSNGYYKMPNGFILQWGNFTSLDTADTTITFPVAFPTAILAMAGIEGPGNHNGTLQTNWWVVTRNKTQCVIHNASAGTNTYTWLAIGY